jgi:hypothetical protein
MYRRGKREKLGGFSGEMYQKADSEQVLEFFIDPWP